jgi:DNA polymerase-3 subunit delta'
LFLGDDTEVLTEAALALAALINCPAPPATSANGRALAACGHCSTCRRIASRSHPDIVWVRPQNKMRQIDVHQAREVIHQLAMKPTEARHKVAVFVGADRMNTASANAFLKTLEEPPAGSLILLLSTEPDRLLETILSRCQRLNFGTGARVRVSPGVMAWLREFGHHAAKPGAGLLPRYQLLGTLLNALGAMREEIETSLTAASPLERYPDASPEQKERWEDELKAAIESEYRLRRGEYLAGFHGWLRDIWLQSLTLAGDLANFAELSPETTTIGRRVKPVEAAENLDSWERTQRLLHTNVQEALALEVGLLRLHL